MWRSKTCTQPRWSWCLTQSRSDGCSCSVCRCFRSSVFLSRLRVHSDAEAEQEAGRPAAPGECEAAAAKDDDDEAAAAAADRFLFSRPLLSRRELVPPPAPGTGAAPPALGRGAPRRLLRPVPPALPGSGPSGASPGASSRAPPPPFPPLGVPGPPRPLPLPPPPPPLPQRRLPEPKLGPPCRARGVAAPWPRRRAPLQWGFAFPPQLRRQRAEREAMRRRWETAAARGGGESQWRSARPFQGIMWRFGAFRRCLRVPSRAPASPPPPPQHTPSPPRSRAPQRGPRPLPGPHPSEPAAELGSLNINHAPAGGEAGGWQGGRAACA
ncbi:uncharacterized protein LOC118146920 [Callithrix jacchus]